MTDNRLERYKEALRTGHVAALRGRLEDALAAYGQAAAIAADRATPRTAMGGIQLRLGNAEAALAAYEEALSLAPDDDGALHGRTQALVALGRPADAAAAFDRLAEVRAGAGKLAEACNALRRALEIETSGVRRHRYQELARELRLAEGDEQAERALARALRLLEDGTEAGADAPDAAGSGSSEGEAEAATTVSEAEVAASESLTVAAGGPAGPAGEALAIAADEAARQGDARGAVTAAMAAARAFQSAGHAVAALEACVEALADGPDDVSLHLLIAELQVASGWPAVAGETYRNLIRLAELDGDPADRARIAAAARSALPRDSRFADADA